MNNKIDEKTEEEYEELIENFFKPQPKISLFLRIKDKISDFKYNIGVRKALKELKK